MINNKEITSQFKKMFRYGMVGLLGTALHFASVIFLVEKAFLDPVIGSGLGFILVLVVSFFLNRSWTFRSNNRSPRQFLIYTFVSLIGLGLNCAIMFFAVHIMNWNYLYGQCLVVLVVPLSNYILNYKWTFREDTYQQ